MWLAGVAMLTLSVGYLLLVVLSGKVKGKKERDPAEPERLDGILEK